jgi:hypothetical protein
MIRLVFAGFVLVHGLIHILGYLKAFGIGNNIPLSKAISKPVGLLWLLPLLLFAILALFAVLKKDWWYIGIAAVVLSQILIVTAWSDAKFGTLANMIILLLLFMNFMKWDFRARGRSEAGHLLHAATSPAVLVEKAHLEKLPDPVKRWLERSGIVGRPMIHSVRLKQKGLLRMAPDSKWMNVEAEQYFDADSPSFLWLANIEYGITHIAGKDVFSDGSGKMIIKAASVLQIANASGDETDQGTMLRYLAEIQWFPTAALSKYIQWDIIDSGAALATMTYNGKSVSGTFFFNDVGDVTAFQAQRYMESKGKYSLETWVVPVDEYSSFEGVRVPSKGRTIWKLKSGDFNWFNWEITNINYNRPGMF